MGYFDELRQRRVFRVAAIYGAAAFVVLQAADLLVAGLHLPAWLFSTVTILTIVGFPIALVLAWAFQLTPASVQRSADEVPTRERALPPRTLALVAALLTLGALGGWLLRPTVETRAMRPGNVMHITTSAGLELDPALSPDGNLLAFAAGPPGEMRIYVQPAAGGRTIAVTEGLMQNQRAPQWSPDGTQLLFQAGGRELVSGTDRAPFDAASRLYTVPALGGTPRRIDVGGGAISGAWSHDGRNIAFVEANGIYGVAIWIASLDASEPPRRIVEAGDAYSLSWSPDGSMLAFVRGNPRFVFGSAHLGNDAPTTIWTVTLDDRAAHRVTKGESLDVSPVWTPDGRGLLFVSNRDGARDIYRVRIDRTGAAAGDVERITSGLSAHTLSLSRDGRRLAYSAFTNSSHIWAVPMPATGEASLSDARQLTFGNETVEGVALSADGKWLAYDSNRSGNGDIWKIPSAGGTPQQLTTNRTGDYVQDFSPDGREISYHSIRGGLRRIFVMNDDGTGARQVTSGTTHDANPEFCADGNTLVYDSWDSTALGIWRVARARRDGPWSAPRQVTTNGTDPSCSPDGHWIAYVVDGGVRVIASDGRNARVLAHSEDPARMPEPDFVYWAPDSRTLYYKAYDDQYRSSIWSVSLAGGRSRLLLRFPDLARPSQRREFATDGRTLYFTISEPESDIWIMELR